MPKETVDVKIKKDEIEKGRKKGQQDMSMALFSYAYDETDYASDIDRENGTDEEKERAEFADSISEDQASIFEGTQENNYNDMGKISYDNNKTHEAQRDTVKKAGVFYKLFNLGSRISDYQFKNAHFTEVDHTGDKRIVVTNDEIDVMPGMSIDAASMKLGAKKDKKRDTMDIGLLEGGKKPILDIFTGKSRKLFDFKLKEMELGNYGGSQYLTFKTEDENKDIEEKLSDSLTRKITIKNIKMNASDINDIKAGNVVIDDAKVSYTDTKLDATDEINQIKNKDLRAIYTPGFGLEVISNEGKSLLNDELAAIEREKQLEPEEDEEVQAPVRAPKKEKSEIQKILEKENKKPKKKEKTEDFGENIMQKGLDTLNQKGLKAGLQRGEKSGRIQFKAGIDASADLLKYKNGKTKKGVSMEEDYGGFANFLFGKKSTSDKKKYTDVLEKLEKGDYDLKENEYDEYYKGTYKTGDGKQLLRNLGSVIIGQDNVDLIHEISVQDNLDMSTQETILYHYVDTKVVTLVNEIFSKNQKTPALDYLKEYFKAISHGEKEPSVAGGSIKNFSMPTDDFSKSKKEKDLKINHGMDIKVPVLPFVMAGFKVTPKWGTKLKGDFEIYPEEGAKSLGEGISEFKEKAAKKINDREKLDSTMMDSLFLESVDGISYHLKPSAYADVNAGLDVSGYLSAGAGMILSLKAALTAALKGSFGAKADLDLKFTIHSGNLDWDMGVGAKASLEELINLSAALGINGGLTSDLFAWDYELFKIDIFKLALKDLGLNMSIGIGDGASALTDLNLGLAGAVSAQNVDKSLLENNYSNFVIEKKEEPVGMNLILKEAKDQNASIESLKNKTKIILAFISDNKNKVNIVGKAGAFDNMKTILVDFAEALRKKEIELKETVEALTNMISGFKNKASVKKQTKKIQEKLDKHQGLIDKMALVGQNGDTRSALEFYRDQRRIFTGKNDFEHYRDKKIKEDYMKSKLRENALDEQGNVKTDANGNTIKVYQDELNKKITKEVGHREDMIERIKSYNPANPRFANISFYEYYQLLAPDSNLLNHLGYSDQGEGSKDRYADYLNKQIEKKQATNKSHIEAINEYVKQNKISKLKKSKAFSHWYFEEKGWGSSLMDKAPMYLAPNLIISFLQEKLRSVEVSGSRPFERIQALEGFQKEYNSLKEKIAAEKNGANRKEVFEPLEEQAKAIRNKARDLFFAVPDRDKEVKKNIYRVASKEDIMKYESTHAEYQKFVGDQSQRETRRRAIKKIRNKLGDNFQEGIQNVDTGATSVLNNQLVEIMQNAGLTNGDGNIDLNKTGFWKNRAWYTANGRMYFIKDAIDRMSLTAKSSVGKRKDLVKETVSLQSILDYEKQRAADPKTKERHEKIYNMFKVRLHQIETATDGEDKKALVKQLRADYFAGKIDEAAGVSSSTHNDLVNSILDGKKVDYSVILGFLEKDQESYMNEHGQRLSNLKQMYDDNKDMDDNEAYYRYHRLRDYSSIRKAYRNATGYMEGGFEKEMRFQLDGILKTTGKDIKDYLSIDQMLRYEKRIMARESRMEKAGLIGTAVVDKMTDKIPLVGMFTDKLKYDEQKGEDAWILYQQGVYGLYEKVKRWDKELDKAGKAGNEKNQILSERIKDNMLTGAFSTKWFFEEFFNEVSPEMVLDYERRSAQDNASEFIEQLEELQNMGVDDKLTTSDQERLLARDKSKHSFYSSMRFLTGGSNKYRSDYDVYMKDEFEKGNLTITPDMAIAYQQRRIREIVEDAARIKFLVDHVAVEMGNQAQMIPERIEEEQFKLFMEKGGFELYSKEHSDELNTVVKNKVAEESTKEKIIEYEQTRISHYQELMETLNKPVTEMKEAKQNLSNNIDWTTQTQDMLNKLTPETLFTKNTDAVLNEVDQLSKRSDEDKRYSENLSTMELKDLLDELKRLKE